MTAVSVVTPSFNQGRFIDQTIQSVLEQDLGGRSLDYVIVDGASSDETLDVLRRYDGRLRWISEPDRGQAHAVNKGLRLTTAEVIGWLNSDDIYYPGALKAVCEFLEEHPSVDVVYGDAYQVDERGHVLGTYATEAFDLGRLTNICFLCQPAVFFRRRIVEQFGTLDERLHVALDYEYWLRLGVGGATFAHLPRVLAGWRLYPNIKSYTLRLQLHNEVNGVMLERLGRVPDQWIYNYAHARLERLGIHSRQHVRFAVGLAAGAIWASLRWNHSLPPSVRATTLIWLKDGAKLRYWSLRAQLRAQLR